MAERAALFFFFSCRAIIDSLLCSSRYRLFPARVPGIGGPNLAIYFSSRARARNTTTPCEGARSSGRTIRAVVAVSSHSKQPRPIGPPPYFTCFPHHYDGGEWKSPQRSHAQIGYGTTATTDRHRSCRGASFALLRFFFLRGKPVRCRVLASFVYSGTGGSAGGERKTTPTPTVRVPFPPGEPRGLLVGGGTGPNTPGRIRCLPAPSSFGRAAAATDRTNDREKKNEKRVRPYPSFPGPAPNQK